MATTSDISSNNVTTEPRAATPERRKPKVFVSYRQDDAYEMARGLANRLAMKLGQDNVFRDEPGIPAGAEWRQTLREQLLQCDVVVLVIGKDWLRILDEHLTDDEDIHRQELEDALHLGKTIIPVLVRTTEPEKHQLPPTLEQLAELQYIKARYHEKDPGADKLIETIDQWRPSEVVEQRTYVPSLTLTVPADILPSTSIPPSAVVDMPQQTLELLGLAWERSMPQWTWDKLVADVADSPSRSEWIHQLETIILPVLNDDSQQPPSMPLLESADGSGSFKTFVRTTTRTSANAEIEVVLAPVETGNQPLTGTSELTASISGRLAAQEDHLTWRVFMVNSGTKPLWHVLVYHADQIVSRRHRNLPPGKRAWMTFETPITETAPKVKIAGVDIAGREVSTTVIGHIDLTRHEPVKPAQQEPVGLVRSGPVEVIWPEPVGTMRPELESVEALESRSDDDLDDGGTPRWKTILALGAYWIGLATMAFGLLIYPLALLDRSYRQSNRDDGMFDSLTPWLDNLLTTLVLVGIFLLIGWVPYYFGYRWLANNQPGRLPGGNGES